MSTIKYYDTGSSSWKYLPQGPVGPQGPTGPTGPAGSGSGDMLKANNLSDLASIPTAKTNLGLNNVDNTSDATKNAAVATLSNKTISGASNTLTAIPESAVTNLTTDLALKAPLASPTFTGTTTDAILNVTNTNGTLSLTATTDGGDFNIYHTATGTKTLAFYGSGANIMNVSILDGTLDIGGVLVPTISSTHTLTNKTLNDTNNVTLKDSTGFTLEQTADTTRKAVFALTNSSTGTTLTFSLPNNAGTLATVGNTETFTNKRITKRVTTATSTATPTPAGDTTDVYYLSTLTVGATFAAPTGTPTDGQQLTIRVKSVAAQTLAWNAIYLASGVAPLPTTSVAGKTITMSFTYDAAQVKWVLLAVDAVGY